jgi:hypothetical protein
MARLVLSVCDRIEELPLHYILHSIKKRNEASAARRSVMRVISTLRAIERTFEEAGLEFHFGEWPRRWCALPSAAARRAVARVKITHARARSSDLV